MKNILFVGAHHDDLELSIGGSVKRWSASGCNVFSAILTDSTWKGPKGTPYRNFEQIEKYCNNAAKILDYTQISLKYSPCFELNYSDEKVVDLLNIIEKQEIDTLITIWPHDAHRDHRIVSEIALAATRKIPRVLFTQTSWNSTYQSFSPKFYVDITDQLQAKQQALRCYEDEYNRVGHLWEDFVRSSAQFYGLKSGCKLAEGFEILKYKV